MKRRVWPEETLAKKEQTCVVCGEWPVELAHVTGRIHDRPRKAGSQTVYVEPESVVPLCPPHHKEYDAHQLDLVQHLETPEQIRAVQDLGGLVSALRRTAPKWMGGL